METVIYSASPLQTFLTSILTIGFFVVLGVLGLGSAAFRKSQGTGSRILLGGAGCLLLVAAIVFGAITVYSMTGATRSVTAPLSNKDVAQQSCGENDSCPHYILTLEDASASYDFDVAQAAYDKVEIGQCYRVTFYPQGGIFGSQGSSQGYVTNSNVAEIVQVDGGACQ